MEFKIKYKLTYEKHIFNFNKNNVVVLTVSSGVLEKYRFNIY